MEKVVNVDDLSIEDLMKLIEQKKLSKKQKITCNDLDNLLIKRKPFIESDPSRVYFNHITTSVSSTYFGLNDHNYVTADKTVYIEEDNILSLLKSNANIKVKTGVAFKTLSEFESVSSIYNFSSDNLNLDKLRTELTNLDKDLSSLEVIEFRTERFDLGIFCTEIYDDKFKLIDSNVISVSDGSTTIEIGESVTDDTTDVNGVPDVLMSTVKDSMGNVYSITGGTSLSEVDDYLNLEKELTPTNLGLQLDFKMKQSTPSVIKSESDVKYFKGFLIFNSYLDVVNNASDYYQTTMIWINQPTLITTKIQNTIYTIKIGDFINITIGFLSTGPTGRLYINLPSDCDRKQTSLPVKSKFFSANFTGSPFGLKEIVVSKLN